MISAKNLFIFFVWGIFMLAGPAACSQNDNTIPSPAANPPISDVPIPDGMTIDLDHSQSTVVPGSNLRLVNHEYDGSLQQLAVTRFFQQQMPQQGWQYVEETQNPEGITLYFTKGQENCTITVTHSWFTTKAFVSIAPAGSGSESPENANATTEPSGQ